MVNWKERWGRLKSVLGVSLSLAKANFKIRNEGSYLGILWYLMGPLLLFLVIFFIRGVYFSNSQIVYYPVYLMMGLIMFNFFSQVSFASTDLIAKNRNYIKTMKISHESLVISLVSQFIFSHIFEFLILIIFFMIVGVPLTGLLIYPLIFLLFCVFILGFSFLLSTIGVFVNDLGNIWAVINSLLLFVTPLGYGAVQGGIHQTVNYFNPLFYFVEIGRSLVIYRTLPPSWMIFVTITFSFLTLIIGYSMFYRYKNRFAEVI